LPWQRSLRNRKKLKEVKKPLHPSINAEILVKIGPLSFELPGLECRPLKNKIKNKKDIGKIYSKFAKWAKLKYLLSC